MHRRALLIFAGLLVGSQVTSARDLALDDLASHSSSATAGAGTRVTTRLGRRPTSTTATGARSLDRRVPRARPGLLVPARARRRRERERPEVGLYLDLRGAAQLFLDGKLLYGFGRLPPPAGGRVAGAGAAESSSAAAALAFGTRYRSLTLPAAGRHTLAVRYDQRSHHGLRLVAAGSGLPSRARRAGADDGVRA